MFLGKKITALLERSRISLFAQSEARTLSLNVQMNEEQHAMAAAFLGYTVREVPISIARFMHASLHNIYPHIAEHGVNCIVTENDFKYVMRMLIGGMQSAHQRFGIDLPEIEILEGEGIGFSRLEDGNGKIEIGKEWLRSSARHMLYKNHPQCGHATHTPLSMPLAIHIAGFEEMVHAYNQKIDPENMEKWDEGTVTQSFQSAVRNVYYKNPAEIFAGLYVRDEIRRKCNEDENIIRQTYEADKFVITLYDAGKLSDLPSYITDLLEERRIEINSRYGVDFKPVAPFGMRLEAETEVLAELGRNVKNLVSQREAAKCMVR